MLKAILLLPEDTMRIRDAQKKASKKINEVKMVNGSRYDDWDKKASVLLMRYKNYIHIVDDEMRFNMRIPYFITVMKHRERIHVRYKYSGLSIGIYSHGTDHKMNKRTGFDMLLAIDSESFPSKINTIAVLEENWRNNIGSDAFKRTVVLENDTRRLYEIRIETNILLSGYEAYIINENIGHMVRLICPSDRSIALKKDMNLILESFKTVNFTRNN